jgi:hypothetical protein
VQRLGFSGEGRPALTDEEIDFLFAQADRGTSKTQGYRRGKKGERRGKGERSRGKRRVCAMADGVCASLWCADDNGMLDFKEFVDRFWELGKHRHTCFIL